MNNKGTDQSAQMRRLACAYVVRKPPKTGFVATRPNFNVFNKLWKRDKVRGLLIIVSLFRNEFNQVSNSIHVIHDQNILDCIYHMAIIQPNGKHPT